jgi:N-acetylmuramoyl-L-alanine amidase
MGQVLHSTIREKYAQYQPGRGYGGRVKMRNLMILRDTKPVAVLVELGNIRHPGDQVRLVKPGNRQALADWIAEGLAREAGSTAL